MSDADLARWNDWLLRTGRPDGNHMPAAFTLFGGPSHAPKVGCRCHHYPKTSPRCRKHGTWGTILYGPRSWWAWRHYQPSMRQRLHLWRNHRGITNAALCLALLATTTLCWLLLIPLTAAG